MSGLLDQLQCRRNILFEIIILLLFFFDFLFYTTSFLVFLHCVGGVWFVLAVSPIFLAVDWTHASSRKKTEFGKRKNGTREGKKASSPNLSKRIQIILCTTATAACDTDCLHARWWGIGSNHLSCWPHMTYMGLILNFSSMELCNHFQSIRVPSIVPWTSVLKKTQCTDSVISWVQAAQPFPVQLRENDIRHEFPMDIDRRNIKLREGN